MNTHLSLRFLIIITIGTVIPTTVFAGENLTPEQLVLLMKASRGQYNTISAKMKALSYQYDPNNKAEPKLKMTREIVSRWTRKKSFSRIVETSYLDAIPDGAYTRTTISTCSLSPKGCKKLVEAADNPVSRGYVEPDRSLDQGFYQSFFTVYAAMWDFYGWPWEKMNVDKATVTRDEKNNYYIMKVKMGTTAKGPLITLYVDPLKDFIPVKKEFLKYDGTMLVTFECTDFHQMPNGFWIPYQYSWFDPRLNYGAVYEIEKVVVNEPIPDNLLDFAFPSGTVVRDEISSLQYRIDDVTQPQDTIADPCSETTTNIAVTVPAKDEDLVAAASKAKGLLDAHAVKEIVSPAIEVSPGIVLVTVDKSEYKLSIKKYDGTKPVLLDYEFESTELKLSSFKNLIKTEDQVIANINRVQSHTGFASGTLLLQYAAESKPVKVTFVSAPLPNAP
jgi:hypothetical protein